MFFFNNFFKIFNYFGEILAIKLFIYEWALEANHLFIIFITLPCFYLILLSNEEINTPPEDHKPILSKRSRRGTPRFIPKQTTSGPRLSDSRQLDFIQDTMPRCSPDARLILFIHNFVGKSDLPWNSPAVCVLAPPSDPIIDNKGTHILANLGAVTLVMEKGTVGCFTGSKSVTGNIESCRRACHVKNF